MLDKRIVGVVSWTLTASGLIVAGALPYSLTVALTGFGLVLLGGLLYARLIYGAQKEKGIDTWHK